MAIPADEKMAASDAAESDTSSNTSEFDTPTSSTSSDTSESDTPTSSTSDNSVAAPDSLNRSMTIWNSFTMGFAVVSPVVGLYAIFGLQTVVTGGGWFAALALCLVMQMLVATVYAELSSQFPIAGGAINGHANWVEQLPVSMQVLFTLVQPLPC